MQVSNLQPSHDSTYHSNFNSLLGINFGDRNIESRLLAHSTNPRPAIDENELFVRNDLPIRAETFLNDFLKTEREKMVYFHSVAFK